MKTELDVRIMIGELQNHIAEIKKEINAFINSDVEGISLPRGLLKEIEKDKHTIAFLKSVIE
jgi:hypothetical protein